MPFNLLDVMLEELYALFDARDSIQGKVDLQKSVYFMKELGCTVPFSFRWNKLGPYSHELASFVDFLVAQDYLSYRGYYQLNERAFQYVKRENNDRLTEFFGQFERLCDDKGFDKIDFIECAASLHFLRKYSRITAKNAVFHRLEQLKPEKRFVFEPLRDTAWDFLQTHLTM